MSKNTINMEEKRDYAEPSSDQLRRLPRVGHIVAAALEEEGQRIKKIDGDDLIVEPHQEGVIEYPAVTVTDKPRSKTDINHLTS
jgi:hypothetical protein